MALLHLINKSPFSHDALASALKHAVDGCGILLLEDGVYAATRNTAHAALFNQCSDTIRVYALLPDLKARGIDDSRLIDGIQCIDYDGFVDLVAEYSATQTWL